MKVVDFRHFMKGFSVLAHFFELFIFFDAVFDAHGLIQKGDIEKLRLVIISACNNVKSFINQIPSSP